jgi:predicted SprT family Zn-dependent metalloprotease
MIHLWLHVRGLPHGHTPEFRAKARELGQPKTRHNITLPKPKTGWEYSCDACGETFMRRRRFGRPVACLRCCKRFARGEYDARFKLKGKRLP